MWGHGPYAPNRCKHCWHDDDSLRPICCMCGKRKDFDTIKGIYRPGKGDGET